MAIRQVGAIVEIGLGVKDIVIMRDDSISVIMTISPVSGVYYTVYVNGVPVDHHIQDSHHMISSFKKAVVKRDGYWRG